MKTNKISTKLLISFSVVLAILLVVGAIGIAGINVMRGSQDQVYNANVMGMKSVGDISANFTNCAVDINKVAIGMITGDSDMVSTYIASFNSSYEKTLTALADYEVTIDPGNSRENEIFQNVSKNLPSFKDKCSVLFDASSSYLESQNTDQILLDLQAVTDVRTSVGTAINDLSNLNTEMAESANKSNVGTGTLLIILQIGFFIFGIVMTIVSVLYLTVAIEKDLKTIVAKLIVSTDVIDSAATQLNEASENLANGASRQAASIEETSATMNESASMSAQNAENTRHSAQIAQHATELSNLGMERMTEMVAAMDEIKESSDTIGKIVNVIDNIAFQTNLLAINATVEAARAGGEAGRSFSVVAQEVRNLAQRSANAAADTTAIIEKNISLTAKGREVSKNVSDSLEQITKETEQLNRLIAEINAASEEQASGIKQINIAISQMEKVTQDNAAVAEENAAASNSMKTEILNLRNAVNLVERIIRNPETIQPFVDAERKNSSDNKSMYSASSRRPAAAPKSTANISKPAAPAPRSTPRIQSQQPKSDAEKIIPLDDDDSF